MGLNSWVKAVHIGEGKLLSQTRVDGTLKPWLVIHLWYICINATVGMKMLDRWPAKNAQFQL